MGNVALMIVVAYMVVLLLVSWYAGLRQRNKSAASYLFAGKQLTWPLVGVMIAGIAVGGASTVGIAQNAYTMGMSAGWYNAAWAAGALVMGLFFAERMRSSQVETVNQMLATAFGARFEFVSTVIQIVINVVIIALQIIAGGAILHGLLPNVFTLEQGVLISTLIFGMISTVGGLLAASLTNVVNLIMIYVGIILGVVALIVNAGGFGAIEMALPVGMSGDGSHWFHPFQGMGMAAVGAWFVTMILQCTPNGGVVQNIFAAKSPEDAKKGGIFAAVIIFPIGFISAIIGIIAASQLPGLASSAAALPTIVMSLPGWIAGIILAGLWAADVSTATGLMMGVSSMFCNDILFRYIIKTDNTKTKKRATRLTVFGVVLVAYLAATQMQNILGVLITTLSLFAPYAILLTLIFWFPGLIKRFTGWLTLGGGATAFVIVQFIAPSLRLGGQTVYSVVLVSLAMVAISQFVRVPVERAKEVYNLD